MNMGNMTNGYKAAEGKVWHNKAGDYYVGNVIYLGINDSIENWEEVGIEEVPEPEPTEIAELGE